MASSLLLLLSLLLALTAHAANTQYIYGTSVTGVTQQLAVDRTPALYTGPFGDCLRGHSLFNVSRFDAAYYADNSSVLFHLRGHAALANESLVMSISMAAYGQSRLRMTFDPCSINIYSLCPLNASVPVTAWAVFTVGPQQLGDIPPLALTIPDLEGSVTLQVFGNTSRSEIACFQASLTNGVTMAYPAIIGPILAVFALVAIVASFVTAAYGVDIPVMRTHYAHSLSALLVLETFQTIFFSGALGLSWPSILVAWWSNFAWSAGQIYDRRVLGTVDPMAGNVGNTSQVGHAGSSVESVLPYASGLAQNIYRRLAPPPLRRQPYNASDPYDYTWAGDPVYPGVALPGTWSGYRGTLAALNLPVADTFAIGLLWLLVVAAALVVAIAIFKCGLEVLRKTKRLKKSSFTYFRHYWVAYSVLAIFRVLYAAFAMIMTLAILQFSLGGSPGAKALAAVVFVVFLVGNGVLVTQACRVRLKNTQHSVQPDLLVLVRGTLFRFVPFVFPMRMSSFQGRAGAPPEKPLLSLPFLQLQSRDNDPGRISVHQDEAFVKRYGWLTARYRRSRWWFFSYYPVYHLFRAAIVGGGAATPKAQVLCLLVYEVVAFLVAVKTDPFEGRRNTVLAVWLLGVSKVLTTALSIAFLPSLATDRIAATAVGVIIIAIQGLLVVAVLVLVALGAVSSYLSLSRDKAVIDHKELEAARRHYFAHIQAKALDDAKPSRVEREWMQRRKEAAPVPPSFTVTSVRRVRKIYDEDEDTDLGSSSDSLVGPPPSRLGRAGGACLSTHSLPRGGRAYRASWRCSSPFAGEWEEEEDEEEEEGEKKGGDDQDEHDEDNNNNVTAIQTVASRRRRTEETTTTMMMKRHNSAVGASLMTPLSATLGSFEDEKGEGDQGEGKEDVDVVVGCRASPPLGGS